jgi:predicted CxxxxCH...CXXCH cytochrome family protein
VPHFHVNGRRDVDFDRRDALPGLPWRPYWYGPYGPSAPTAYWAIGGDAADDATNKILSFSLGTASWDPSSKTCTSVACHFNRTQVRWGEPLVAAGLPDGTCGVCHAN